MSKDKKYTIKPAEGYVFIKPIKINTDKKTASGFYLPDKVQSPPVMAEVINVGDNTKFDFKPKDRVIYSSHTAEFIKLNGEEYAVILAKHITGKVEEYEA